jgi:hypothetical protein
MVVPYVVQHKRTPEHLAYERELRKWHALGERARQRYGKPAHVSDRDALRILVNEGVLPPDHGIAPRDVYALMSPTRHGARFGLMINRLGPWQHPGWGPVMTKAGYLFVLDFRPAAAWHRQQTEAGGSTCDCVRPRP